MYRPIRCGTAEGLRGIPLLGITTVRPISCSLGVPVHPCFFGCTGPSAVERLRGREAAMLRLVSVSAPSRETDNAGTDQSWGGNSATTPTPPPFFGIPFQVASCQDSRLPGLEASANEYNIVVVDLPPSLSSARTIIGLSHSGGDHHRPHPLGSCHHRGCWGSRPHCHTLHITASVANGGGRGLLYGPSANEDVHKGGSKRTSTLFAL